MFDIKCGEKINSVYRTSHTNVSRQNDTYVRDMFIDLRRYKEIISMAIRHGLSSFRNKGPVVISFSDTWRSNFALLVTLDDERLTIITMYDSKKIDKTKFFIKVHNRINLWHYYQMKTMTKEERRQKRLESIKIDIAVKLEKEGHDSVFEKYVSFNNIKKE
jgi:hypothetical protein